MRHLIALPALALLLAAPAQADGVPPDIARVEVLPGWRAADGRHMAALRVTLAPGWKTYWRAPGAAGLPPVIDLAGSDGIAATDIRWPVPDVFHFNGMRSIGYHDAVTIPLDLSLAGGPARLEGDLEIGVCKEICVPVRLPFAADLPDDGRRDPLIAAALVDQPMSAEDAGARATCSVAPDGNGLALTVRLALPPLGPEEAVVIESGDPMIWVSEATSERDGSVIVATAKALARSGGALAIVRSDLRITVLAEGKAVDIHGCQAG